MQKPKWTNDNVIPHPIPYRRLGDVILVASATVAGLLVLQHFGVLVLPWSAVAPEREGVLSLAGIAGIPTCFFSLTYLAGLIGRWVMIRQIGVSGFLRWLVRCTALASVGYLAAMAMSDFTCPYTLAVHVLYLVFWPVIELAQPAPSRSLSALVTFCAGSALLSAFLYLAVGEANRTIPAGAEHVALRVLNTTESSQSASAGALPANDRADAAEPDSEHAETSEPEHGTRLPYRKGAADAPVRVLMFCDYQSPPCRDVDERLQSLVAGYKEFVSLSTMHYPLCAECNFSVDTTTYPTSCKAAQAVETAGILNGAEGFWEMHDWIFQQKGQVTDEKLAARLSELEVEAAKFFETMNSNQVLSKILSDVVEAQTLGVSTVPTVFVNGERLTGPDPEKEVLRAVLGAANLAKTQSGALPESDQAIEAALTTAFPRELQVASVLATVRIRNPAKNTNGSGVVIAIRPPFVYVLTAKHIVTDTASVRVESFSQETYPAPDGEFVANVLATSSRADLAIIRYANANGLPTALSVAAERTTNNGSFPAFSVGCSGMDAPTCVADTVTRQLQGRREDATVSKMWETQNRSEVGRSGGPLINDQGKIIGIATGMSGGKGYFSHLSEVDQFLRVNGLRR